MVEDTPDDIIHDLFAAQVWEDHPLGRPILGTRDLVTGFSREAIADYFADEYVPPRIIIAVAGNVTHEQVVELFGAGFNGFRREARIARRRRRAEPHARREHRAQGARAGARGDGLPRPAPRRPPSATRCSCSTTSSAAACPRGCSRRSGSARGSSTRSTPAPRRFPDTGLLYVYAATDARNFSKVLKSTLKELRDLKKNGITAEELKRAKDHLKGSLMLSLESTSSRMNRLAKHEMHLGSFLTMDDDARPRSTACKHDEVQALVGELLDEDRLALTTLGPLDRRNLPAEFRSISPIAPATLPALRAWWRSLARASTVVVAAIRAWVSFAAAGFALWWGA